MVARLFATLAIWIAGVAVSIPTLINTLTYTTYRVVEITPQITTAIQDYLTRMGDIAAASSGNYWGYTDITSLLTVPETTYAPWYFQLGVFVLCLALIGGAIASTIIIWNKANEETRARAVDAPREAAPLGDLLREQSRREKAKRQPRLELDAAGSAAQFDRLQDLMIDYQRGTLDLNTLSPDDRALVREAVQTAMESQLAHGP